MRLKYAGNTNVGMTRDHNEDNFLMFPEQQLFVVADGMGGHAAGEVASQIVVDTMRDFFAQTAEDENFTWPSTFFDDRSYDENRLSAAVKLANRNIYEASQEDVSRKGMGTTFVGMVFAKGQCIVGHAGDSRCYLISDGKLTPITEDHSLLNDYRKIQALTPEEEEAFQYKNVIVRALGMKDIVEVDINIVKPKKGDILLLCSDGLSGEVTDPDLEKIVNAHADDLDAGVASLIQTACDNGGKDNITAILVKYLGK